MPAGETTPPVLQPKGRIAVSAAVLRENTRPLQPRPTSRSELRVARGAGVRDHVPDVAQAGQEHQESLKAQPKT